MDNQSKDKRLFHIKPFSLSHHNSSMRVGTDAMLLGLFIDGSKSKKVLEIGTGCGIISLLIASRYASSIDAIDIDSASIKEANTNFERSPFHHRLKATEIDFKNFPDKYPGKYDLIVSNPPFFINDFRPDNQVKLVARHTDSMSYLDICKGAAKLLKPEGKLCVVLPFDNNTLFIEEAMKFGLHLQKQQLIFPKRSSTVNRINMQFGFAKPISTETSRFYIREDNGSFTDQYIRYLKDYYIGLK